MKEKLNIALVGCSPMGKRHAQGVITNGAVLYAVCDTAAERLEEFRNEFEPKVVTSDYHELLDIEELDAVIIVTPDQLHREMVTAFLMAGKDVLCEKPMALTVAECEDMILTEKKSGRQLMIGQICRCNPTFIKAKELIDQGRIGELVFVESEYAHNYDEAKGYNNWRMVPERNTVVGGGCHAIDLLRWIAGDPTEVYAYTNHKIMTDWPTDDTTIAIYKFPNDVMGKVLVSNGAKRAYTMRSVFYGTKGTIIAQNQPGEVILYEDAEGKNYHDAQIITVEAKDHNAEAEVDIFVKALMANKNVPVSSYDGASTVAVACATVEATKTGKPVNIRYPKI
ncbi:MAG: Gfo/Idh/MocA family oxidoreductase [Clostridia bacterium]|nr:Gfo/Idh/MocA family oxidoreductase [Clostridia bacterium]